MLTAQHSEEQEKMKGDLLLHRKQIEAMIMQNREVHITIFRCSISAPYAIVFVITVGIYCTSRACTFHIHR